MAASVLFQRNTREYEDENGFLLFEHTGEKEDWHRFAAIHISDITLAERVVTLTAKTPILAAAPLDRWITSDEPDGKIVLTLLLFRAGRELTTNGAVAVRYVLSPAWYEDEHGRWRLPLHATESQATATITVEENELTIAFGNPAL